MIYSTAYLPNIAYYSALVADNKPYIEVYENFVKQTFRNRCNILAANGILKLIIPLEHARSKKTNIKDVKIAYHEPWQKQHWRSIVSAYSSSPFFEYFTDDFKPFYHKEFKFLYEFNISLLNVINGVVGIDMSFVETKYYDKDVYSNSGVVDIVFKGVNKSFKQYPQVFDTKFGFVENLSIIDLIFNMGPEAKDYFLDEPSTVDI
ncbi:MAG: WbqC family protein [Bacteroidales bacterium]